VTHQTDGERTYWSILDNALPTRALYQSNVEARLMKGLRY